MTTEFIYLVSKSSKGIKRYPSNHQKENGCLSAPPTYNVTKTTPPVDWVWFYGV
jgi:hypothetical protein